ncbi:hypothetical protein BC6307_07545 [Sutcliffiella cohnii]|uniref:DUF3231 family protein n=1 Tax=Sutcliffiella cohnii TaxID=33932 RepID=A0A223KP85_9BACI|nr:DUF3231 family protein [Sutcliffiella cohnii]AST91143.1 hypothetical protein BC6307_07545 [Sutcliffiella cohnii]
MSEKSEIVKLTSAEIAALWTSYMNINVVICFMAHFLETCDDPDILAILKESNQLARKHETELEQLFTKEKIVIPTGFKVEKHVVSHAPKLFSDVFYIQSVLQMSQFGVATHTANLTISAREDIRKMFKKFIDDIR